ncbi:hypothetical protein G4228_020392 [Cervus hanglu yarkandensis]|uniref:Uncharacterized protein n=1 Tax=Cervus hanglu yarkandensis TaxID=84702 RepID=A0A833SEX7_9CERV|nr:hypothetical protein G4228_020392 [Cervus hanglu yarkandensis]
MGSPEVHGFQEESPEELDPLEQGLEDRVATEAEAEKPVVREQLAEPGGHEGAAEPAEHGRPDCSKLVLLSAVGSVFCCGLDFIYFIRHLTDDHKRESARMAEAIRSFVNTFIHFTKPIIVAVIGPAIWLGASILPLCDLVWANEKAWFQTPYTTFGQSPDGCSTVMFPKVMGGASANEMLLCGLKLKAQEVSGKGLVSWVFWPGTFIQDVMDRIKELTSSNPVLLEESNSLVHCNMSLELKQANERECEVLKKIWGL